MDSAPPCPPTDSRPRVTLSSWEADAPAPWGAGRQCSLLSISVPDEPSALDRVHWVFSVDRSGSMDDRCKDGKTKAEQIAHTLRNLIAFLSVPVVGDATPSHLVYIQSFDTRVENLMTAQDPSAVTEAALEAALRGLAPRGATNVGAALRASAQAIEGLMVGQRGRVVHILLTDGHITAGETRHPQLSQLVPKGDAVRSAFLGYGAEHCSYLLQALASGSPSDSYHFVDSLEHAGMVYGEVAHKAIYEQCCDVRLTVNGGDVYDISKGQWCGEICLGSLTSEEKRDMLVRHDPGTAKPTLSLAYKVVGGGAEPIVVTRVEEVPAGADMMEYAWARQRCMEAMAAARRKLNDVTPPAIVDKLAALGHAVLDLGKARLWDAVWPVLDANPDLLDALPSPRRYRLIHHAASQGNLEALKNLVKRGATIAPTADGASTQSLARHHPECSAYLSTAGPGGKADISASLDALLAEMRAKADEQQGTEFGGRYKQLADDMYVARLSLTATDRSVGAMYLESRTASQDEHRAYQVGDVDALHAGQTQEGQTFRSLNRSYRVAAPGASEQASVGAANLMAKCMGGGRR